MKPHKLAAAFVALSVTIGAQPARANDPLDGLTASNASALASTNVPVLLPARVPAGYRIYAVRAAPDFYEVIYSNGTSAFVVKTMLFDNGAYLSTLVRATGEDLHSALFGTFRLAEGTASDSTIGCLTHLPAGLKVGSTTYNFAACGSLTTSQLADVVVSSRRFTHFRASPGNSDPAPEVAGGLSATQLRTLRSLPMAVVLPAYLPSAFHVARFQSGNIPNPGGANYVSYLVTFSDGRATIEIEGSRGGASGGGDVPMRQLKLPVHSKLLGEATLVAEEYGSRPDCITTVERRLAISLAPGYKVGGCGVSPYELKRVIESARLIRPL